MDVTVTSWATDQFGEHAREVARRIVLAMATAQEVGARTQRASGQSRRYAYGSTWTSKYEQLLHQFTEVPGSDLPPVERVPVAKAPYSLVMVNGCLLIPFTLARSLADVPDQPRLNSEILRAITAETVPAPAPEPSLLDFLDDQDDNDDRPATVPGPRSSPESLLPEPSSAVQTSTDETGDQEPAESGRAPVFIGLVCNADTDALLALWWGMAESINSDGVLTWSPETLPLELASSDELRVVPGPRSPHGTGAFDEGVAPDVQVTARPYPVNPNPDPPASEAEKPPRDAAGDTDG